MSPRIMNVLLVALIGTTLALLVDSFQVVPLSTETRTTAITSSTSRLFSTSSAPRRKKKGYEPKWKKKATLADQTGKPKDFKEIGLIGTIPVVFKQGNETKSTMALPNQPLRDVASQAGQFIQYGCGKGECGTCEALCDGKWIRPCSTNTPSVLPEGQTEMVIQVKEVKNKSKSSGKFYSVRSFLFGFYNNVLGMIGMVLWRKKAKQNWNERQEYEDLVKQKTLEKKRLRAQQQQEGGGLKP